MAAIISGFWFFLQKKQKCSRVSSNCHIGMKVGAFESSDNEETFLFLLHGEKIFFAVLDVSEHLEAKNQ